MRNIVTVLASGVLVVGLSACDVEQTEEGELPEINVEEGNMPDFNVDTADVDVEMETRTVEVPTLEVEDADAGAAGEN